MKSNKEQNTQAAQQDDDFLKLESFKLLRAREWEKGRVFFDAEINGIKIYGLQVVPGRNGDFISFPAQKSKDGKYYNTVFFRLREETQKSMLAAVQDYLDR